MSLIAMLFIIFIFIWLPAQWSNGTSFGASIAPNNPFTLLIWLVFVGLPIIGFIACSAKDSEDRAKLEKQGKLKPGATKAEFEKARIDSEQAKKKEIFDKQQRWLWLDITSYRIIDNATTMEKRELITKAQVEIIMDYYWKCQDEKEEIRQWFLKRQMYNFRYQFKDYNDYSVNFYPPQLMFMVPIQAEIVRQRKKMLGLE